MSTLAVSPPETAEKRIAAKRVIGVLSALPPSAAREILRIAEGRAGGLGSISEIRLRRGPVCELILGSERIPLSCRPTEAEMAEVLKKVTDGGLYAHRDSIAEGYVPMPGGVRVGVCGRARYDGGRIVGISSTASLVFRIPRGGCDFSGELEELWDRIGLGGVLIFSPPGGGKTTALRHLAGYLGGSRGYRVAVVDERCEFDVSDYADRSVDVLSGYRKAEGIEIAARTLSPEVIMVDELAASDAASVMEAVKCGIPIIATAHARDTEELLSKAGISELSRAGVFSAYIGIRYTPPTYQLTLTEK